MEDRLTVILVHGTGADLADDHGTAWWQIGGKLQTRLQDRGGPSWNVQPALFQRLTLHPSGEYFLAEDRIFHWSGKNSERTRRAAARELAVELAKLEQNGKPYALVGHSHGGSVVWHAMLELYICGRTLSQLRAVVTLGTPFLRFGPSWALIRQLVLFLAAFVGALMLSKYWPEFWNQWSDLLQSGEYASLLLAFLSALGWSVVLIASLIMSLACAYNTFCEYRCHDSERGLLLDLGDRLVCIALQNDEAINALAVTVPLRSISDRKPAIYAAWITRITDWIMIDRLVRQAAGNDIPGLALLNVGRTPVPHSKKLAEYPTRCRDNIQHHVEEQAGRNWLDLENRLRASAENRMEPGRVSDLVVGLEFGDFLTHCRYYEDDAIEERILSHLRGDDPPSGSVTIPELPSSEPAPEYIRWVGAALLLTLLLMVGFLVSRTGDLVLNNGIIKTIIQRAPFADTASDPMSQLRYLHSLAAVGHADEARRLVPDIELPEEQQRARGIITNTEQNPKAIPAVVPELDDETTKPAPAKLLAAFPEWPIEKSLLGVLSAWDPDETLFKDMTIESEADRARMEGKPFDEKFTKNYIGEEYMHYLARQALLSIPKDTSRVTQRMSEIPTDWRDLSQRWLTRARSKWGERELALPYLQKYTLAARALLAGPGLPGKYPRAAAAMELLDLSDSFNWLGQQQISRELQRLGERELAQEGLELQGSVAAILWANQGRLDRMEALMEGATLEQWRTTIAGTRKFTYEVWRWDSLNTLPQQYIDALLKQTPSERLQALDTLIQNMSEIKPIAARSAARKEISLAYLGLGRTRTALDVADGCTARDRLNIYSAILQTIAGIRHDNDAGADLRYREQHDWNNILKEPSPSTAQAR